MNLKTVKTARYIVYDVSRLGEAGKIEPHMDNQSQVCSFSLAFFIFFLSSDNMFMYVYVSIVSDKSIMR